MRGLGYRSDLGHCITFGGRRIGKTLEEYAVLAYNAYGDSRDWKTFNGDEMPQWDEQSSELREAWKAAAQAVATAVREKGL